MEQSQDPEEMLSSCTDLETLKMSCFQSNSIADTHNMINNVCESLSLERLKKNLHLTDP